MEGVKQLLRGGTWLRAQALAGVVGAALLLASAAQAQTSSLTRTSGFEYDAGTGMLTKEVVEPDLPNACLQTVYSYDGYGNTRGQRHDRRLAAPLQPPAPTPLTRACPARSIPYATIP